MRVQRGPAPSTSAPPRPAVGTAGPPIPNRQPRRLVGLWFRGAVEFSDLRRVDHGERWLGMGLGGLRKSGSRPLGLPWIGEGCPATMGGVAGEWGVSAPTTFAESVWWRTLRCGQAASSALRIKPPCSSAR